LFNWPSNDLNSKLRLVSPSQRENVSCGFACKSVARTRQKLNRREAESKLRYIPEGKSRHKLQIALNALGLNPNGGVT